LRHVKDAAGFSKAGTQGRAAAAIPFDHVRLNGVPVPEGSSVASKGKVRNSLSRDEK
jgi:hypothetical protein